MTHVGQLRRVILQYRGHGFGSGIAAESAHTGEHLVKHSAEGEDVAARISRFAANLLRRHVARGTHDDARRRMLTGQSNVVRILARVLRQLRQSKIQTS